MKREGEAVPSPPAWRRLGARLVLVGGVALAASWLAQYLPRDQELVFRIPDPSSIRRLDLSLTRDGEKAPENGVTLNFPSAPPSSIRHRTSLPNGRYQIAISVRRQLPDGPEETSWVRRVSLDGGETLVVLEGSP